MRAIKWTFEARTRFLTIESRRIQERILASLENAARFPGMFPRAKSRLYPELRAIPVKPFIVLYDFNGEVLVVVAVYHQKQHY
ncbi:MAG: type II toxin-antitoxin system RelE/ParE family toxin [Bacillota bacterium]